MPTLGEEEVCKFAAGYVPSPLQCGCSKCCPALARAECATQGKYTAWTSELLAALEALADSANNVTATEAIKLMDEVRTVIAKVPPATARNRDADAG